MLWQIRTTHKNEDGCKKAIRWCEEVRALPTFLSPFRTLTTTYLMFLGAAWFSNIRRSTFLQYWTHCYTYVPHQTNYFNKSSNYHILTIWQFEFHSERSGSNATIDTSSWCVFISSVRSSNSHPDLLLIQPTPTFSDHTGPRHWTFTFWATTAI